MGGGSPTGHLAGRGAATTTGTGGRIVTAKETVQLGTGATEEEEGRRQAEDPPAHPPQADHLLEAEETGTGDAGRQGPPAATGQPAVTVSIAPIPIAAEAEARTVEAGARGIEIIPGAEAKAAALAGAAGEVEGTTNKGGTEAATMERGEVSTGPLHWPTPSNS